MEAVALFFGIVMFAGAVLICVVVGYSIPEQPAPAETPKSAVLEGPHFLKSAPPAPLSFPAVDEAVVNRLESYLKAEQNVAGRFVSEPSFENLHRQRADQRVSMN